MRRATRGVTGVPGKDFGVEDVRGVFPEELEIKPLNVPVDATLRIPGSKSITNRALIIAALADGVSTIENPLFSDDSYWLMSSLVSLGFEVRANRESGEVSISGLGGDIPRSGEVEVFVGNAGTAARFLPPMLALGRGVYRVDGVPRMRERPLADLVDALRSLGTHVEYAGAEGRFPLVVRGGGLRGGTARVRGSASSQFLSGLLMSAPYADDPLELEVVGELVSRPYVGITTGMMRDFGVEVIEGAGFLVRPGAYQARRYAVEADASGASYFFAAAALTGGRVRIEGLRRGSLQGDLRFVEVLKCMGCEVEATESYVEVRGPGQLSGIEVDMNEISDTMITLAAIAPFANGPTTITNVSHTRHQETDRIAAVAAELVRLGVTVEERADGLRITPGPVKPASIRTYGDHRIAMAFSLIGLRVPGIRILDPACVTKTMPGYFDLLRALG